MSQLNLIYTWQLFFLVIVWNVFSFSVLQLPVAVLLELVSSVQTLIEKVLGLLFIIQNERLGENWEKRKFSGSVFFFSYVTRSYSSVAFYMAIK